ncbi:siderophore ABC transporter substrate-binding protein [Pseudokineococcus sp. 1T1Z-3]|uniref:siderophore ABC transporter substrate-binding protein n=1 Tax=Pseudokineococcus sp. 1T1Z-3 TaxID=3132745 RepID=UPI0030B187A5
MSHAPSAPSAAPAPRAAAARTRRPAVVTAASAAALLALAACGSESSDDVAAETETITVTHAQGEEEVPLEPQRVVVHDLSVLDTLSQLDVEVVGVPDFDFAEQLPEYADVATVGTLHEPDVEAVAALDPDLIIVAARSSSSYDALSEVATTIDMSVDSTDFLPSARERVTTLGEIFGQEAAVEERFEALDAMAQETSDLAADAGTALIVMTIAGEVSVYGAGSRFNLLYDELGYTPADPDIPEASHGDVVSFEYIAETDPDHLFVMDRDQIIGDGATSAEQVLDNPLVNGTTAVQEGQVAYLDPFAWYLAPSGLGSLETMVSEVNATVT